jgi:hypothetical protein
MFMSRRASAQVTVHLTPEGTMNFKNAVRLRPPMIAFVATVALSAGASPAVATAGIAKGAPIGDPGHYGDWIADVERPSEQFRGRVQVRLGEARELLRD